jgi:hypothetical protein
MLVLANGLRVPIHRIPNPPLTLEFIGTARKAGRVSPCWTQVISVACAPVTGLSYWPPTILGRLPKTQQEISTTQCEVLEWAPTCPTSASVICHFQTWLAALSSLGILDIAAIVRVRSWANMAWRSVSSLLNSATIFPKPSRRVLRSH